MSLIGEQKPAKITQVLIPGRVLSGGSVDGALLQDNKFVQSLYANSAKEFFKEALDAAFVDVPGTGSNFVITIVIEEPAE